MEALTICKLSKAQLLMSQGTTTDALVGAAQMVRALQQILTDNEWWHLPRYAMGTSRGGAMALILALHLPLQARTLTAHFPCVSTSSLMIGLWPRSRQA